MITEFLYPTKKDDAEAFIAANPGCHVWHNGTVMVVYTEEDLPPGVDTE